MTTAATKTDGPTIVIIYHSIWGHVRRMAEEVAKGVRDAGCNVLIRQVKETLPDEVIAKMYGVPQAKFAKEHPIITHETLGELADVDGFIWGCPTRFGMLSAQFKAFLDSTGKFWKEGTWIGKPCGIFFCTATLGGGQETTALTAVTQMAHHGMIFVPIGYGCSSIMNMDEVHGGSPYGAGTLSKPDGSRQPSELELGVALYQGKYFAGVVNKLVKGAAACKNTN